MHSESDTFDMSDSPRILISYEGAKICSAIRDKYPQSDTISLHIVANRNIEDEIVAVKKFNYDEPALLKQLAFILTYIGLACFEKGVQLTVIQAGRNVDKLLKKIDKTFAVLANRGMQYIIVNGQKTTEYFDWPSFVKKQFLFIHIGMAVRCTDIAPGTITIPQIGYELSGTPKKPKLDKKYNVRDSLSLLQKFPFLIPSWVISIPDDFPYVTPSDYSIESIIKAIYPRRNIH